MAGQLDVWQAQQFAPESPAYNIAEYLEIHGDLVVGFFVEALRRAVDEAETLRVRFRVVDGVPKQHVDPSYRHTVAVIDVSAEPDPAAAADAWMRRDLCTPADLTDGPLFAHAVFTLAPDHHLWYHRYHHLIMDGRSVMIVARRVAALYDELLEGRPAGHGALEPLAELLEAERAYRASPDFGDDRKYWLGVLDGLPEAEARGSGGPRLMSALARHTGRVDAHAAAYLKTTARRLGTDLAGLMITAAAVHQHGVTGERDIVIGLPVHGLPDRRRTFAPATTANNVPIRLRIDRETTVADLVRQTNTAIRQGLRHQRYRYEDTLRDLRVPPGASLCDLHVNVMSFGYPEKFGSCAVTGHNLSAGAIDGTRIDVYDRPGEPGFQVDVDVNLDVSESGVSTGVS
jgi:hypothetical protein